MLDMVEAWMESEKKNNGHKRMIPIATISRDVGHGGGLPLTKICQGLLAYSLTLSEKQHIAFSPISFVGVCVRSFVCVVN